uniref:Uncharacterized protein n=1 Tax=Bracon brevicornis TaxID=1563983 RepID=A0A6V7IUS4_9HYME
MRTFQLLNTLLYPDRAFGVQKELYQYCRPRWVPLRRRLKLDLSEGYEKSYFFSQLSIQVAMNKLNEFKLSQSCRLIHLLNNRTSTPRKSD